MLQTKILEKVKTHALCSKTSFRKSCRLYDKYRTVGQATDDNMAHAHFTLGTKGYRHTLRICNTYWFSAATTVVRTRHNVNVIRTLAVVFSLLSLYQYRQPISAAHTVAITTFASPLPLQTHSPPLSLLPPLLC
jgi:hypothetical protein